MMGQLASLVFVAVVAAVMVGDARTAWAKPGEIARSPLDYYDQFEPEARDDWLIRIRRDFNNDGREDQAITFRVACGVVCPFEIWLQEEPTRYRLVGNLDMRWEAYGLTPREVGKSELQLCSSSGAEFDGTFVYVISSTGIAEDSPRSKALSKAGTCDAIGTLPSYPCERCSLAAPLGEPESKSRKPSKCRSWIACD